jgi:hypothetical protein
MKIAAVTKARIGFAIAFGVLIGVGEAQAIAHIDAVGNHVVLFCLVIAGIGLLSWCVGQYFKPLGAGSSPAEKAEREKYLNENPLIFLRSLKYWGMIVLLASAAGVFYRGLFHKRTIVAAVEEPEPQAAVNFPSLELQGLVLNGTKSSAMINGQVLFVGEGIGKVQLLAVDSEHATVGLDGQTKVLTLRR